MSDHNTTSKLDERTTTVQDEKRPREQHEVSSSTGEDYTVFSPNVQSFLVILLGVVMVLSTLTATIYFPLIPMLSDQLSVSVQAIDLTVTVYVIFQALTPAIFASLSDSFGRRPVLLGVILIYASASLGLFINSHSYPVLLVLRALQSVGGSATTPLSYGIVADVAVTSQRGKMLGPMLAICNGISAFGPVIGGAIALGSSGVKWVFAALLVISVACLVATGIAMPETARCIAGNGSEPAVGIYKTWWDVLRGSQRKKTDIEDPSVEECPRLPIRRQRWCVFSLLGTFRILVIRDAAPVLWVIGVSYAVYYTFQVAIPVIFDEIYHYNELQIGLALLPGLAGMTIGGLVAGKLLDRNYEHVARETGVTIDKKSAQDLFYFPVEYARYRNCLWFFGLELALVVAYGWAVAYRVHPAVPITLQFFICGISTLLSHTASALLVDIFPDQSSTAYAAAQAVRCGLSAVSSATIEPLISVLGRGWYFTALAVFVSVNGCAAVLISRKWGMKWRQARCSTMVETS
ncbi:major facilitator superfamily domain-containing protein [Xylariaceae sp. FL1019]|nr:major facilitator superfamily domain-containing protein [Xylariaceae sp. FL1019]